MRFFLFLLIVLATPVLAHAEVLTWDCNFETRIDADGKAIEKMHLIFKVDTVSKKAYMEGNAGLVEVKIFIGPDAFSFTEQVESGTVQTTTITKAGLAVHSRNTVMFGEIVAAQHFGMCLFQ